MKPRFFKIISLILTTVMLAAVLTSAPFSVCADDSAESHITEIHVTKAEIQAKGAFKAIQPALNSAHYSATKDNVYKVIVEPGKYELRYALHIYSNTILSLNNVELYRYKESISNMIRTGDDTATDKGATGYSQNTNITIEGGTLNGNSTSNTMVKVTHASNFTMAGTALANLKNAHMMEVAAVDGLVVRNCSFKNQVLDADEVGYEAIQLDIPKEGHIFGCRSEAINIKNVLIDGCYFTNCPRAVGSHTQILNNPFDGIVITNSTFKDIKSAAIQAENWKNVQITNNRIENTPRAVAFYSLLGNADCGFKASVLAKEGKTETSVPDSYQTPFNANILISGNIITNCGNVKDIYADYEPLAISFIGKNLKKALRQNADGSGGYPKGNYYISGITIKNNTINTAGDGIYLENIRNIAVDNNSITCAKSKYSKKVCNPITALTVNFNSISGNAIDSAPYHGMELAESSIKALNNNSVTNTSLDGIILEAESKVTGSVTGNFINKISRYGINIRPKSAGGSISGNIICNCSKGAVQKEKKATGSIGSNYYTLAEMNSLTLDKNSLNLGENEKYSLSASYSPVNCISKLTWKSSDSLVAGVSEKGVVTAHSYGEADITVQSESGKKAVCHVKVMPAPKDLTLNATMLTIGRGETFDLDSQLSEGTIAHAIEYTSNNPSAVSVERAGGLLTGVGIGTATVAAKTYNGVHAGCNVIVKEAPYDIWFDSGEMSMGTGETASLNVNLPEGSASNSMIFRSDNESVVSVDQRGEVKALSAGEATVTAEAFNGTVAICKISVKKAPVRVSFSQREYTAKAGEPLKTEVVFDDDSASNALSFQSSDLDICRVNRSTGELSPKKKGTVTITVKTFNHVAATCKVVVK